MLIDVLQRLSADLGIHQVDKRNLLLKILNDAAKELHGKLECNKIYREVTLVVPVNKVVSLPSFIGELKGMRVHSQDTPATMFGLMFPRYIKSVFDYLFHNWRDLGDSPVHTLTSVVGGLTLTTNAVEDAVVLISGQTLNATQVEEEVTVNAASVSTQNAFGPQIYSIACSSPRIADITILDMNAVELAVLHNNLPKTRYKIVDVSELCFPVDTTESESLIDVCYKLPVTKLTRDSDSFYAGDDYDEAWYNMSMFVYLRPIAERAADAITFNAKALNDLKSAKAGTEDALEKRITFGPNKYYGLFNGSCGGMVSGCTDER